MANAPEKVTFADFVDSLRHDGPPAGLDNALQALWFEARASGPGKTPSADNDGNMPADWNTAHRLVQRQRDASGRWVHGYLHRLEGDDQNAAGWYERAGQPFPTKSTADEWADIASALLSRQSGNA